jgi:hypothetical protein
VTPSVRASYYSGTPSAQNRAYDFPQDLLSDRFLDLRKREPSPIPIRALIAKPVMDSGDRLFCFAWISDSRTRRRHLLLGPRMVQIARTQTSSGSVPYRSFPEGWFTRDVTLSCRRHFGFSVRPRRSTTRFSWDQRLPLPRSRVLHEAPQTPVQPLLSGS